MRPLGGSKRAAFLTGGLGLLMLAVVVRAGESAGDSASPDRVRKEDSVKPAVKTTIGADGTVIQVLKVAKKPAQPALPTTIIPKTTVGADGTIVQVVKVPAQPINDANVVQAQVSRPVEEEGAAPAAAQTQPIQQTGAAAAAPTLSSTQSVRAEAAGAGTSSVSGGETQTRPSSDVGDLLSKSQSSTGIEVQHRSPIVSDARIRGYQIPQIITIADGAYYVPSRRDLDTIVSKIDANSIQDVIIYKGPYSVRYGPGLASLDIETIGAQRFKDGWEAHGSTRMTYKTNGNQWRGQQTFWGGAEDWGFRFTYDLAAGSDYESGADVRIPSSYNSQNIDFAYGYWLSDDSNIQVKVNRLDQHDLELPGQVFDISRLISDGYSTRYTLENQALFDKLSFDAWYNYTRLQGDNTRGGKREQIPQLNLTYTNTQGQTAPGLGFVGFTEGDTATTGFRNIMTWGKDKGPQLSLGVDLRYVTQKTNEFDTAVAFQSGNYPIPRSHYVDPGFFLDSSLPVGDSLKLKAGTRFDFVGTNIDSFPTDVPTAQLNAAFPATGNYSRHYELEAAYLAAEYKLWSEGDDCSRPGAAGRNVTAIGNVGYGMRAPTITELYAFDPLVSVLQNGLNSVRGNPNLSPEKDLQFDLGLRADLGQFRGSITGFYANIEDYITLDTIGFVFNNGPNPKNNGLDVGFVNTHRATLSGGELAGEFDLNSYLTPFTSLSYVQGRDQTRNQHSALNAPPVPGIPVANRNLLYGPTGPNQEPLPGIAPLEARIGIRFHEPRPQPKYGVELTARIVASQEQFAQGLGEEATPGFTVWDLRTYWQASKALLLTFGVENLGNKNYQEHLDLRTGTGALGEFGVFQPGVNFYFGAQLTY